MTEEDNALVERLRDQADRWYGSIGSMHSVEWEAAERIEVLSAENERLREALVKASRDIQGYKDALAQVGGSDD